MDEIAPRLEMPVFAQTAGGTFRPGNIQWCDMVDPAEFEAMASRASLIVAHAGIGSVLMAQKHRKPIIIFPRRAALGEHRNDHQLATCVALENRRGVHVAHSAGELERYLRQPPTLDAVEEDGAQRRRFIANLAALLNGKPRPENETP